MISLYLRYGQLSKYCFEENDDHTWVAVGWVDILVEASKFDTAHFGVAVNMQEYFLIPGVNTLSSFLLGVDVGVPVYYYHKGLDIERGGQRK